MNNSDVDLTFDEESSTQPAIPFRQPTQAPNRPNTMVPLAPDDDDQTPHDQSSEQKLLDCVGGLFGNDTIKICVKNGLKPEHFYDRYYGKIYSVALSLHEEGGRQIDRYSIQTKITGMNAFDQERFDQPFSLNIPTGTFVPSYIKQIKNCWLRREALRLANSLNENALSDDDPVSLLEYVIDRAGELQEEASLGSKGILASLNERRIELSNPPEEPEPVVLVNGAAVCTPGNLTSLIAQAKSGKSAWLGALMAAAMLDGRTDQTADCLGVSVAPGNGKAIVHIDTEQSLWDAFQIVRRSLRRANVDTPPEWLHSYACAGWTAKMLRDVLPVVLESMAKRHGGVRLVLVDGLADFATDVNDAEECNGLVAELHGLAIKYNCPIICVIHENPTQTTGKGRGHLGSQLERKSESNLRLLKEDGTTVLFSEKQRGAPISQKDGPRFAWSDEAQMHVSVTTGGPKEDAKVAELRDLAVEVFGEDKRLKWADVISKIMSARTCSKSTAERHFRKMKTNGTLVAGNLGLFEISTQ